MLRTGYYTKHTEPIQLFNRAVVIDISEHMWILVLLLISVNWFKHSDSSVSGNNWFKLIRVYNLKTKIDILQKLWH